MKLRHVALLTVVPSMLLVGCGGEERRSVTGSSDLTGLWRTTLTSAQIGLDADSNISYLLDESSQGLFMTSCINRTRIELERDGNTIKGLPVGDTTVVDNDTVRGSGDFGNSRGSKIALPLIFDMGTLSINGSGMGNNTFTDLCIISSDAKVLGKTTYEEYSAATLFKGETLELRLRIMANIGAATYSLVREPAAREASLVIRSQALIDVYNRTEVALRDGTVTITEDSNVWLKGNYSGVTPDGVLLTGDFEFEKP
ncbi:MAG: hypothetical protein R3208_17415 [Ketobacteraceae bacterium]|nr:hypothetical protein [Ketobacteraceae bacterium]